MTVEVTENKMYILPENSQDRAYLRQFFNTTNPPKEGTEKVDCSVFLHQPVAFVEITPPSSKEQDTSKVRLDS